MSYSLTSEVAAYLPLLYRLLLSNVDRGVELRCHVVTRPPVGHAVSLPEVRGEIEGPATVLSAAAGCPSSGGVPGPRGYVAGRRIFCLDGSFLVVASS